MDLRRSRTRMWERPLRILLLRPYRCRHCGNRQYSFTWPQGETVRHPSRSLSLRQFPADERQAAADSVRGRKSSKAILIYGLLLCLLAVGIFSVRFRNTLVIRRALNALPSPIAAGPNRVPDALPAPEIASSAKSFAAEAPQAKSEAAAETPRALPPANSRAPVSREEGAKASSSAEAMLAPRPKIPGNLKSRITSDNTVDVRVRIDKSGRVIAATPVSASGPVATSLVRYALATARRWRFRPARQNGKPVSSNTVLEFHFRPSENLVSRVDVN
jgi:TonB family protein